MKYAAEVRARSRAARSRAARDRQRAAADRKLAAADRELAAHEREMARAELLEAHLDDLTGTYLRPVGLAALQGEIDRARRSDGRLVLAFVDVDRLKETNDRLGHDAGDELLRRVVEAIRAKTRSYEPIVRFGGDEFVCSLSAVDTDGARGRLESVSAALRGSGKEGSMSFGLAALGPDDSLEDLIGKADADLRKTRTGRT